MSEKAVGEELKRRGLALRARSHSAPCGAIVGWEI
jgi:hypothetical protein